MDTRIKAIHLREQVCTRTQTKLKAIQPCEQTSTRTPNKNGFTLQMLECGASYLPDKLP